MHCQLYGLVVEIASAKKEHHSGGSDQGYGYRRRWRWLLKLAIDGAKFPKLQVLTIEGLLNSTEHARYLHQDAGGLTFEKAKREENEPKQKKLF
ncbi:MAG TPA: hypothetical protein VGR63_09520 [Casimicrobiaceae bacterium]|jgi:hypothetical protein|nr:hypothetical protein [Casimicrobiaceae bacterium]